MTRRFGLSAAVLIALAGCGSHHDARKQATPTATAGTQACSDPDERTHAIRFRTGDGVSLAGAVVGSGPVGAVLIHEYPLDHCGWWPYARYLSRHGVRVLMFDLLAARRVRVAILGFLRKIPGSRDGRAARPSAG